MRLLLIFLISVLPLFTAGQYTYFNTHIPPLGGPDAGSGTSTNLMVRNNELISVINNPNFGNISMTFNVLNLNGVLINQVVNNTNGQFLTNYADSFDEDNDGYIGAGFFVQGPWPSIRRFDSNLMLDWEIQVPIFYDDQGLPIYGTSQISGQFHFAKKLNNGDFIAAGPIAYFNGTEPLYTNLWMVRYDANQQLVWEKQLPLYQENIIPESKKFLRVNKLFEMSNGDLLVWGCWYHSWQPMVLRFDSEGNFLSHTSWGSPGPLGALNDWLPWPVQINEEDFAFAYTHGTYQNEFGPQYTKPRMGFFNSQSMTVELLEPLEHEYYGMLITDFEKTPDGGYVMLGYGYDGVTMGFTFMIKLDENGEEEWFKQYVPTIPYHTANGWDLEITPDGGLAFVGNFFELDEEGIGGAQNTWVVKTDGCGEVEYNGCAYTVGVDENLDSKNSNLKVWPNPANTLINLEYTGNAHSVELIDLYGKTALSKPVTGHPHLFELMMGDLAPGIYLVQLLDINGSRLAQTKVVKQ